MASQTRRNDTGAGTPLTAREQDLREQVLTQFKVATAVFGDRPVERDQHLAIADEALAEYAASRGLVLSRPATDPAGLDALRAELVGFAEPYDGGDPMYLRGKQYGLQLAIGAIDSRLSAARLSVADGPGPEERLRERHIEGCPRPGCYVYNCACHCHEPGR